MKLKLNIVLFTTIIGIVFSQFGQNIVQYDDITWNYIKSPHFDIYYYDPGLSHAELVASEAEKAHDDISSRMLGELNHRVSIIIYNSHNDFQQTNVVESYMYEGVGGVTELFKNRVVLPFDGSNKEFRRVIHHELVHAFINDRIYGGNLQSLINSQIKFTIPGWMNEGLAEYLSSGWDTNSDMWMRDLAINGGELPEIDRLTGYLAYRGGQSVWKFITEKWGEEAISEIFIQIGRQNHVDMGMEVALGIDKKELTEQWHNYLKKEYWPDIEGRSSLKEIARKLTDHKKLENTYNIAPAISPDGRQIAIISNKDGPMAMYLIAAEDGRFIRKIIQGERNSEFEELHILKPGITWSPDGKQVAFAAKSGKSDALYIVDVVTGKKEKFRLPVEGIFRAAWSPKNSEISFIGNNGATSDIYLFDIDTQTLTNLTNDWFSDDMVSWSADGESLYFVSDRGPNLVTGMTVENPEKYPVENSDIYAITRDGKQMERITETAFNESYPAPSNDGKMLAFISDEYGINNVYLLADSSQAPKPITNLLSGVSQISWSRDDTQLVFAGFEDSGYDIYTLENPMELADRNIHITPAKWTLIRNETRPDLLLKDDRNDRLQSLRSYENYIFSNYDSEPVTEETDIMLTRTETHDTTGAFHTFKYKTRFTLDLIQPYYDYNTQYSPQMMAFFLWSDILGDHRIYLGTEMDNISVRNSDYFFMYRYLPRRTDFNFLFSHSATLGLASLDYWYDTGDVVIPPGIYVLRSRLLSIEFIASRPFSRFQRLEYGFDYNYAEQSIFYDVAVGDNGLVETREKVINSMTVGIPTIGMVWDNTRWSYMYPIAGDRLYFRFQDSPRWGNNQLFFHTLSMDARHYIPLGNGISFASRMYAGYSGGKNAERFRVGGVPWLFSSEDGYYSADDTTGNNLETLFFSKYITPVRGTQISERSGNKAIVVNLEFRLPFLIYYFPSIKYLGQINGVFFTDFGMAWSGRRPDMWTSKSWNSDPKDFIWTYGLGPRFIFLGLPWQLDYAWQFHPNRRPERMWYLSIGLDY